MEFMLDTADVQAIADLSAMLDVAGVTTNPTIVTSTGRDFVEVRDAILDVLAPEQKFFCQVVSHDEAGIVAEAREIASWRSGENVYAKIPVTPEGLRAIKAVKAEGIGVLATAIYSSAQGFLAAKNGADYLAPYVNRMDNLGDGVGQVLELQAMLEADGSETKIVAASFKNVRQVTDLIAGGIAAVTVPPDVVRAMVAHPGTAPAVAAFEDAWERAYGRRTLL